MDFKNSEVFNFESAIRGMRNPLNSWDKSDSKFGLGDSNYEEMDYTVASYYTEKAGFNYYENYEEWYNAHESYVTWLNKNGILKYNNNDDIFEYAYIGPNDLNLAQRLINSGPEHAKFLRQIFVSVDITAPLYWWKEADTYKVGTTANSTSTMHKLTSYPITKEMFEIDDFSNVDYYLDDSGDGKPVMWYINDDIEDFIWFLESLRQKYLSTNNKIYWRALVQLLPQGWLQTRTWTANYAILRNIYFQRKNHKLKEWHQFCDWIKTLPYSKELITLGDENES